MTDEVECAAPGGLPATGQVQCDNGDGTFANCPPTAVQQDGQQRAGVPRRFVDNGDGTISDLVTGLMWEKQDGSTSETGVDSNVVMWIAAALAFERHPPLIPSRQGFAGYDDWRAPTRRELESLVDLGGQSPAIDPVFHHDCTPGCTLDACACTVPGPYWSSTPMHDSPGVWTVSFADGATGSDLDFGFNSLPVLLPVRMVRGGVTDPVVKPGPPIALDVSVRNPWRSPCVPVQLIAYDADSSCYLGYGLKTLPAHGFVTEFVSSTSLFSESAVANSCGPPDQIAPMNEIHLKKFAAAQCYIPFSPTFTGFDSFTYTVHDNDGIESAPATVSIEIFDTN